MNKKQTELEGERQTIQTALDDVEAGWERIKADFEAEAKREPDNELLAEAIREKQTEYKKTKTMLREELARISREMLKALKD